MIRIAVLDEDQNFLDSTIAALEGHFRGSEVKLEEFVDRGDLIFQLSNGHTFDLYLIDVGSLDGATPLGIGLALEIFSFHQNALVLGMSSASRQEVAIISSFCREYSVGIVRRADGPEVIAAEIEELLFPWPDFFMRRCEMVIQGLEVGEICQSGLEGQLGQIERDYLQRRREIAKIYHSGKDVAILPDIFWKEVNAADDALKRFSELRWQERETSLAFLGMLANNLDKVEPEPVCPPFNLARVGLSFAIDSLVDGRLEAAVRQLELALSHFEEVRSLLRPQKDKARVARFLGRDPTARRLPSRPGMGSQGGDEEWL